MRRRCREPLRKGAEIQVDEVLIELADDKLAQRRRQRLAQHPEERRRRDDGQLVVALLAMRLFEVLGNTTSEALCLLLARIPRPT